jgi:hypothetical protein
VLVFTVRTVIAQESEHHVRLAERIREVRPLCLLAGVGETAVGKN